MRWYPCRFRNFGNLIEEVWVHNNEICIRVSQVFYQFWDCGNAGPAELKRVRQFPRLATLGKIRYPSIYRQHNAPEAQCSPYYND